MIPGFSLPRIGPSAWLLCNTTTVSLPHSCSAAVNEDLMSCCCYGLSTMHIFSNYLLWPSWDFSLPRLISRSGTHDVGFMMYYSYGLGYQLTGNATYRDILLRSALSLSQRYNPIGKFSLVPLRCVLLCALLYFTFCTVGCTESWNAGGPYNYHFPVITDNLMNLELLLWAAANGGDPIWRHMAETHLDRVRATATTPTTTDTAAATFQDNPRALTVHRRSSTTWTRAETTRPFT